MAKLFNVTSSGSSKMKLDKIQIATHPTKTVYKSGESFDPSGMTIEALYTNGAARMITGYTVSPMTLVDAVTAVTVSFAEAGVVRTADQEVTVLPILAGIEIASAPNKVEYLYLDSFSPTGMAVNAIYSDGSKEAVSDFTYQETTFTTLGTHEIVVSYAKDGITKTATQSVSVSEILIDTPTQSGTLVYNGSTQSPTWTGYSSNTTDISGTSSALNAGTYQATFSPKYGYLWKDKTNSSVNVTWSIERASVSVPSQSGSLTYTGSVQSPTWNGYDSAKMTIGSETSGTNAGTYNVTFTLGSNYMWPDGTTTAKTASWSIQKAVVSLPSQSGSLTYTGNAQSPSWSGHDSAKLTIGGTTSGTNAGDYTANFTPTANYKWSDGTTNTKSANWSIGKTIGSLSVSPTTLSLTQSNKRGAISVTRAGDGSITATSSNTGVVAVSVSDTTVDVTGIRSGSATITIEVAAGTNHTAPTSETVSITASFIPALNDATWAEIRQVSDEGQGENYWSVGDRKSVLVNGTIGTLDVNDTFYVYILGFNHNSTKEGVGIQFGTFKNALSGGIDVCLVDGYYSGYLTDGSKAFNMNHFGHTNYGGWKACDMRHDILGSTNQAPSEYGAQKTTSAVGYDAPTDTATNPVTNTLMAALPYDLRVVMKPITKFTDNVGNSSTSRKNVTSSVDYLPLPSEIEVIGHTVTSNAYERLSQRKYAYYSAGNSAARFKHNNTRSSAICWTRSPRRTDNAGFCSHDESLGSDGAGGSFGIAPVFMV